MEKSTSMINILIIETRTNDKPDLFVPMMVVSEDENKLIDHMSKTFTNRLKELENKTDDDKVVVHSAFMDEICARVDFSDKSNTHSIYWTICKSKLI